MAKFIGREMLQDLLNQSSYSNSFEKKGVKGELEVGELLAEYLPSDTYIIAQPLIGRYEPDLLVVSPKFGLRLIEVKNWSLDFISNIGSNGNYTISNSKTVNPIQQLRKHVNELKAYISSNHLYLSDPHKHIGYVVIQYGFNKGDIKEYIKDWDRQSFQNYFKFHIFKDELDSSLNYKLSWATKYPNNILLNEWVEEIVQKIRISNNSLSNSELDLIISSKQKSDKEKKEHEITSKKHTTDKDESVSNTVVIHNKESGDSENNNWKNPLKVLLISFVTYISLVAVIIFSLDIFDNLTASNSISQSIEVPEYGDDEAFKNDNIQEAFTNEGNLVKVNAEVESFHFDENSKNKFLSLEVEGFSFNGIIYKDKSVPYIEERDTYTFYGVTQEYNGEMELRITTVE